MAIYTVAFLDIFRGKIEMSARSIMKRQVTNDFCIIYFIMSSATTCIQAGDMNYSRSNDQTLRSFEPCHEKTDFLSMRYLKTKKQISCDLHLCFRSMDSTIPLLLMSEISSYYSHFFLLYWPACVGPGQKPKENNFLTSDLILFQISELTVNNLKGVNLFLNYQ